MPETFAEQMTKLHAELEATSDIVRRQELMDKMERLYRDTVRADNPRLIRTNPDEICGKCAEWDGTWPACFFDDPEEIGCGDV